MPTVTTPVQVRMPVELVELARERIGPGETLSDAIRRGLALVIGANPDDYRVRIGANTGKGQAA